MAFESRQHCPSVDLMPTQAKVGRTRGEDLAGSEVRPQGRLRGPHRAAESENHVAALVSLRIQHCLPWAQRWGSV